jgi:hypothetical protein
VSDLIPKGAARVTEAEYWKELEFRLCVEFAGLPERRFRYWWCDGLLAQQYRLDENPPRITGVAWLGDNAAGTRWEFALLLPERAAAIESIDWASLLPAENMTCWMSFDEERKYLEIEPAAAKPDLL